MKATEPVAIKKGGGYLYDYTEPLGQHKEYLGLTAIITIIMVTLVWRLNHTAIKYSNQGISPIFGVLFGILAVSEKFTVSLMVGLPMVSLGIFFVNWRRSPTR